MRKLYAFASMCNGSKSITTDWLARSFSPLQNPPPPRLFRDVELALTQFAPALYYSFVEVEASLFRYLCNPCHDVDVGATHNRKAVFGVINLLACVRKPTSCISKSAKRVDLGGRFDGNIWCGQMLMECICCAKTDKCSVSQRPVISLWLSQAARQPSHVFAVVESVMF